MAKEKLTWLDIQELASKVCGISEDSDIGDLDCELYEKYEVSLDQYEKIISDLFNLLDFSISPLTHTAFVGFGDGRKWLLKKEVDQQFIAGVIEWATEGEEIKPESKGFVRTITKEGVPEYDIIIKRSKVEGQ